MKPFVYPDFIGTVTSRNAVIDHLAFELARIQKRADETYYIDGNVEHSSWLIDGLGGLLNVARNMGILNEVYERAYEYYDFRNSGKEGYTLKDGVIVKEEEDGERMSSL